MSYMVTTERTQEDRMDPKLLTDGMLMTLIRSADYIHADGEGCWATGEFDRHDRPYSEKENQA